MDKAIFTFVVLSRRKAAERAGRFPGSRPHTETDQGEADKEESGIPFEGPSNQR